MRLAGFNMAVAELQHLKRRDRADPGCSVQTGHILAKRVIFESGPLTSPNTQVSSRFRLGFVPSCTPHHR